jgi:hypothetical protein
MRSKDVIVLYDTLHNGMHVPISQSASSILSRRKNPSLLARTD